MVTQFQGWNWAQGCPWLSLLIICRSVTQLSRGQRVSSEETEETNSDEWQTHHRLALSDCALLGTLLSLCGVWPSSGWERIKNHSPHLCYTSPHSHCHSLMQVDVNRGCGSTGTYVCKWFESMQKFWGRDRCIDSVITPIKRHIPTYKHSVVLRLLKFLMAVAFTHLQVITGLFQLPHIMELSSTSFLSFSFSSCDGKWMHVWEQWHT